MCVVLAVLCLWKLISIPAINFHWTLYAYDIAWSSTFITRSNSQRICHPMPLSPAHPLEYACAFFMYLSGCFVQLLCNYFYLNLRFWIVFVVCTFYFLFLVNAIFYGWSFLALCRPLFYRSVIEFGNFISISLTPIASLVLYRSFSHWAKYQWMFCCRVSAVTHFNFCHLLSFFLLPLLTIRL